MKSIFSLAIALLTCLSIHAQHKLSGVVQSEAGEEMLGAYVILKDTKYATSSNHEGRFKFEDLPSGKYLLKVSFVGYETYSKEIDLESDNYLEITLKEGIIKGEEVIIYATRATDKTPTTFTSDSWIPP